MLRRFFFVTMLTLVPALPAFASPFSVGGSINFSIGADGAGFSGLDSFDANDTLLNLPSLDLTFPGRFGSIAQIEMNGSAAQGVLKGFATVTADVTADPLFGSAHGVASMEVAFLDTLTITSDTLPVGTLGNFTYRGDLHSSLTFVGDHPNCAPGQNPTDGGSVKLLLGAAAVSVGKTLCGSSMPDLQTASLEFTAHVGDDVQILGRLRLEVGADAGLGSGGDVFAMATGDASNTGNFYVFSNTPGVTFTSASGASYALQAPTAVPEPTSLLLLGTGAAGLIAKRRRRRQRQ